MAKPLITFRSDTDPYPLTYSELDTNFTNLRDATISVADGTNTAVLDLNDTLNVVGSGGATVSVNPTTKTLTVSTADTVNAFQTIAVAGQSNIVADATNDTLTLVAGTGITLTTNATTDSITITSSGTGTINNNTDLYAMPFYSTSPIGGNTLSSSKIIYTPQLQSECGISTTGGDFLLSTDNNNANSSQLLIQDGTSGTIILKSQLSYVTVQRRGSSGLLKLDGESGFIYTENSSNLTLTADGTYDASINLNASTGRITLNPGSTEVVQCQGDLDLTTGVIGTSTTNSGIELEVNGTGVIYLNGPLETNATTGTPVDDTTPVSWLKVTVGASDYYLPLYQ